MEYVYNRMCAEKQNILVCCRESDDVTADNGFVTAVTGSVDKGSTFNPLNRWWIWGRWGIRWVLTVKPRENTEHVMHSVWCHRPDGALIMGRGAVARLSAQQSSWGTPKTAAHCCEMLTCVCHMLPPTAEHEPIQKLGLLPFFVVSVYVINQPMHFLGFTTVVLHFDSLQFF